jgi:hypothetical protein
VGRRDRRGFHLAGQQTLAAPPFSVDLPLLLTDRGAPDSDCDAYSDEEERAAGTDPLDPLSFP